MGHQAFLVPQAPPVQLGQLVPQETLALMVVRVLLEAQACLVLQGHQGPQVSQEGRALAVL